MLKGTDAAETSILSFREDGPRPERAVQDAIRNRGGDPTMAPAKQPSS
jgi:hypothetical protein